MSRAKVAKKAPARGKTAPKQGAKKAAKRPGAPKPAKARKAAPPKKPQKPAKAKPPKAKAKAAPPKKPQKPAKPAAKAASRVKQGAKKLSATQSAAKASAAKASLKPAKAPAKPEPPRKVVPAAKIPLGKIPPAKAPAAKVPPGKVPPGKAPAVKAPAAKAGPPPKAAAVQAPAVAAKGGKAGKGKAPPEVQARAVGKKGRGGPPESTAPSSVAPQRKGKGAQRGDGEDAPKSARAVLAPRSMVSVAPSIPIPVKDVPKAPTLSERAAIIDERITNQPSDFRTRYAEEFDMSWIYHDTALEGVVYTFDELTTAFRADEVTVVDSSIMPIFDSIRRHKEAILYVREQSDRKKTTVSIDLLKKIYVILHPEEGDAKSVKYRRDLPQHRLYFHDYAAPDKIAYKVRGVIDWINSPETRKNHGALRIAAKAHYDLARTYPFTRDSGKVARLFMNLLLMRAGLPPAIIHATARQPYYEALKAPNPSMLVKMLRDSVDNALSSIEKLLDEHETHKRGFVS